MKVDFATGGPTFVLGLGLLPGPIRTVTLHDELLVVDDRHPGEDLSLGGRRARTVTHEDAVRIVLGLGVESAAPEPPSALVGVDEAAAILGVNKRTVERAIRAAPPERCPHRHPGRGRGERARYYWEGEDAVLDWWRARGMSPPPAPVVAPRPRRRPNAAGSLAVEDQPVDWGKVRRSL